MHEDRIQEIKNNIQEASPQNLEELETFRLKFLGKKGEVTSLFKEFGKIPNEQKKEFGKQVNELKVMAQNKHDELKEQFEEEALQSNQSDVDLSLDPAPIEIGARHPISLTRKRIIDIFSKIGFEVSEGPEMVDDWHNFTALNIPESHPARDMQDTFFISEDQNHVLRTHTSSVQVRLMQNEKPPIRSIAPGRVFRKDNDATHSPFFHQVEGLYIDKKVSFADLKQCLYFFVKELFGPDKKIRFRPSYFPFTEPSAEMDISWQKEGKDDWMEVLGCGMVDPNVLSNCGIDPEEYTGYAFGVGIDRIAMLLHSIPDIRTLYENDIRFLNQFKSHS